MPELAEVEYYRKQWDCGLRQKVLAVAGHWEKRVFRGIDGTTWKRRLVGQRLNFSEARAKQMLFCFSGGFWLGIHLGMTGKLRVEKARFSPGKHDHLVLGQARQSLVFQDARMFGRVQVHGGAELPAWWTKLPPAITSDEFTLDFARAFFKRRARLAVKAALLVQSAFPGIGNWMADEILWRARVSPQRLCGELTAPKIRAIWTETRAVCTIALATVALDFSDPPKDWFYHQRWTSAGLCPRDSQPLQTATIGGRTTRWCARCQK